MDRKKNRQGKLPMWQERLRRNSAAMREEFEQMDKRTALYNGTREIEKTPDAKSSKAAALATGVRNIVAELMEAQVDSSFPMPKVTARRQEHEELAKTLEDFLRNETDRLPFEMLNDMDERITPIQGGDIFLVDWDSDRHTHETRGELCVSLLHPRQVIFQDGVNEINDMDFIIVQMGMSKKHGKEKYGVSVADETESDPQSRGGRSTAEDVVTVNFGYFRNDKGGIGRYTWVNDMELEDLEDYQARKMKRCTKCGADMTGLDRCRHCGNEKAEDYDSDEMELYEDIETRNGVIPMMAEEETFPEGVSENGLMMDEFGNAYEAEPMTVAVPTRIPRYKPDIYPIVVRKNVSSWGKALGDSDIDKIMDQQNMIKKCDSRIQEKLDKGGSIFTRSEKTEVSKTDEQLREVIFQGADEANLFGVHNLQVDTNQDQAIAEANYEQARRILGITDSFQGRPDRTATSGTAKQIAVAQSAGRLESKRIMKNAMYADLYAVMFRFLLAYSDEPRSVRHNNIDGSTTYSEFNKYDYLAQDAAGEWYWLDDFLFSVDNTSSLAGNRESMWQEIRMNLQTGAFGDPSDPETLILFWEMMAGQHYPGAAEIRERLEKKRQEQLAQMQMQQMQQLPQEAQMPQGAEPSELHSSGSESQSARRTSGAVPDMAVEDAGGSTMEMMGGLAGGL